MKCQVCQYDLPMGATVCANCGTPVPSSNPYASPASAPSDPYGQASNPYGMSFDNPPPPPPSYGAPPSTYNPGAGGFGTYGQPQFVPQQPKKGPNGCAIAIIVVVALFVLIGGGIIAASAIFANRASQTFNNTLSTIDATATADMATANALGASAGLTPTTSSSGNGVPNVSQIDATAASNIIQAQTSNGMDSSDNPTDATSTFTSGQTADIILTFSGISAGYAMLKIYLNGSYDTQSDSPLSIQSGQTGNDAFTFTPVKVGNFVAGVYWCQQSDCSDAALAQVVSFTFS